MKLLSYTLLAWLFFVGSTINAQEISQLPTTTVEFNSKTIDYGIIDKGSDGKRSFEVLNTGEHPLKISRIFTSSHIKVLEFPQEEIDPGKIALIKILYDTNKSGPIVKTITLHMNVKDKIVPVKIIGQVK